MAVFYTELSLFHKVLETAHLGTVIDLQGFKVHLVDQTLHHVPASRYSQCAVYCTLCMVWLPVSGTVSQGL